MGQSKINPFQDFTISRESGSAALALEIIAKAKTGEFVTVGKFAGFEIRVIKQGSEYVGHITGAQSYKFNVYLEKTTYMATHIASVVEGIDGRIEAWNEALKETQADLEAQQKMIAEPFAKQAELDRKTARFNEIMDILNPKEEQIIGDEEDAVQYQAREKLDDDAGGSISGSRKDNNSVPERVNRQYQERSSPLTDREVLEMAAEGIEVDSLSEAEKNALDIFSKRLSDLAQLQEERAELGRQYKPFVNPFVKMAFICAQQRR